jgi:hypothetical protein
MTEEEHTAVEINGQAVTTRSNLPLDRGKTAWLQILVAFLVLMNSWGFHEFLWHISTILRSKRQTHTF